MIPPSGSVDPPWDARLARAAVRPLANSAITPNQITTLSLALGLVGAFLYARGDWAIHLGAVCFVLSFWLDHADGELARMTGRTSEFGHYYDLAAGGAVLIALFLGIGFGASEGTPGAWSPTLGTSAGVATAAIFLLRIDMERQAGQAAIQQPRRLGFELEDVMYLLGPITWLGLLEPFLFLAGVGAPLFALFVRREQGRLVVGRRSG